MDIGTAKVTAADRARVPHHGLDLVDPDEPFTAADYRRQPARALDRHRGARRRRRCWSAARVCICARWPAAFRWTRPGAIRRCAPTSSGGSWGRGSAPARGRAPQRRPWRRGQHGSRQSAARRACPGAGDRARRQAAAAAAGLSRAKRVDRPAGGTADPSRLDRRTCPRAVRRRTA